MKTLAVLAFVYVLRLWRKVLELDFASMKLLFLPHMESVRWNIGKMKALAVFWAARRQSPAYQRFLHDHHAGAPRVHGLIPDLTTLPVMDKENYIKRYSIGARCLGGRVPDHGIIIDESSGSSGVPTNWVRGQAERRANKRMLEFGLCHLIGPGPYFLINAFALGPWATGINITMALADVAVLKSLGPDVPKILNTLQSFGPDQQYIITGYPPFLKLLVDSAPFDWRQYNVAMIYGGEGMSEAMRDYLLAKGVRRVYGSFGASDLELNISSENDFTIALRKALLSRPELAARLVKYPGATPVVFQFNPADFYIEETPAGELLITLCRPYYLAPKIRYNIHDRGQVVRFSELRRILAECGLTPDDILPGASELPLLLHYGRADMTVSFYGANVAPGDLQEALMSVPALASRVQAFTMFTAEDEAANKSLQICMELTGGQTVSTQEAQQLSRAFFEELQRINQDFREAWRMLPAGQHPELTFHAFQTGPFAGKDLRIKQQYIQPTPVAGAVKPTAAARPAPRPQARPRLKPFNLFDY
ncbi:phenylacetate--CoA ligase family protein [Hymenobacter persicinus]|uniref:CoF synthetase n=1 Tax=Hymenobacter persicinus TaxID=2025506 RepID=A0A4Q5LB24_9BACT|nr:CoF synthetase [Hymenobacter persicinus]RYU79414.1 CoF synthetase [Hymenobacter persicinus]